MTSDLYSAGDDAERRLDPANETELARWAERWRVSKDELRRAIKRVGPRVEDVRQHLIGGFTPAGPSS